MYDMLNDKDGNAFLQEQVRDRIRSAVEDQAVAAALTPQYPFFCKRVMVLDGVGFRSLFARPEQRKGGN